MSCPKRCLKPPTVQLVCIEHFIRIGRNTTMSVILQVNYHWDVDEATAATVAEDPERYNQVPGLQWKLWIRDPQTKTSGGIHLFVDRASAEAYLNDLVLPVLATQQGATDVEAKILAINEFASKANRVPVDLEPLVASNG
jgi:hypothetical protein